MYWWVRWWRTCCVVNGELLISAFVFVCVSTIVNASVYVYVYVYNAKYILWRDRDFLPSQIWRRQCVIILLYYLLFTFLFSKKKYSILYLIRLVSKALIKCENITNTNNFELNWVLYKPLALIEMSAVNSGRKKFFKTRAMPKEKLKKN